MSKPLTIFIDMDEVLNDLVTQWVAALSSTYNYTTTFEDIKDWDLESAYPALTSSQIYEPLDNDEFWRKLRPANEAAPVIQSWITAGHKVYVATATYYKDVSTKVQWLQCYFPMIELSNIIIIKDKSLLKGDVLIDDGVHNLVYGSYIKIIMDKPWNRTDPRAAGMLRAYNWHDVAELVDVVTIAKEIADC